MARPIEIPVSPDVLKWARETSGVSIEDAAKRLAVTTSTYAKWEREETSIKLTHLREMAAYFKRPLAAFFLPQAPVEPAPPRDFRILPGRESYFERKTRLAIRKAMRLRSVAKDLMQGTGQELKAKLASTAISSDPEGAASRERDRLGVTYEDQLKWENPWLAFRQWRDAIERMNVLVFQLPMPVEDARGFTLSDKDPFTIVVSSQDAIRARIFTLFHEYAHLLLRTPGICLPRPAERARTAGFDVEQWCNRFAGAILVPESVFLKLEGLERSEERLQEILSEASRKFKVSEQVVLRRMLDLRLIPRRLFQREMERLQRQEGIPRPRGGPVSPPKRCIAEHGRLFTSIVLEAKGRDIITYSDVSDYLSLRLKYLPEVQSSLMLNAA